MVKYKSFNDLVLDILDYLKLTQPNLDVKPNSVARDLFVDAQSMQVSKLYDALQEVASLQSISNISGQNLTNYGTNFGVSRLPGTKAVGTVVCTFRDMSLDVSIPAGSIFRTRSGIAFLSISTTYVSPTQANSLRANALRLRQNLYTAGINDEFAIEISVEAQSLGSIGNVSPYSVVTHNVSGVNSVTNVVSFTGGTNQETDSSFRARILATFAGTNTGTANAYRSTVLGIPSAVDALVVEPGDPLMVRDGSIVTTDSNGNSILSEPGTGGKVDIYVMGENVSPNIDSFVYSDKSGTNDATNSLNDYVLGLGTGDETLTFSSRRLAVFNGTMEVPSQPISRIVSVSGSISGPNFVEEYFDEFGNTKGNYKLVKDTGYAGGSSFGLDKFSWISNSIELEGESVTKGTLNSIDGLSFTDVSKINTIQQDVQIINENSTVSGTSRNYVVLNHKPIRTINRVYNLTTGERYLVEDQTPDDDGSINTSGRIKISGRTLPTASDILQVDYVWIRDFDKYYEFDNLDPKDNLNQSQDSIDWGYSNYIREEHANVSSDAFSNLTITTSYNISRVLSIDSYMYEVAVVTGSSFGKIVQVTSPISNIYSMKDLSVSGTPEVYNTGYFDGSFSNLVIILPTDTIAEVGDSIAITYNLEEITTDLGGTVTCSNNKISITPNTTIAAGTPVMVNYVANFSNILPQTNISLLPISGDGANSFIGVTGFQPIQNIYSSGVVTKNQRRTPSYLKVTTSNIPSQGIIRIVGTTINKVEAVYVSTSTYGIDLSQAIREVEGVTSLGSNIYVSRVASVESGTMSASGEFSSTIYNYDLTNYNIYNSKWDREKAIENTSLSKTQVYLNELGENESYPIITGTVLRVVFYYAKENDYEDLFFSRNGSLITNKKFGYISSINRYYGMQDSGGTVSGRIIIETTNQPESNNTVSISYEYLAPKENERVIINFEYNKLISDATEAIEQKRPITADVLIKAATKIQIDVEVSIVVSSAYINSIESVKQDVSDEISSALNATSLATTIDSSDIINSIYNVAGVDRVRIVRFNKTGETGTKLSIVANKNEYLAPGNITVNTEGR